MDKVAQGSSGNARVRPPARPAGHENAAVTLSESSATGAMAPPARNAGQGAPGSPYDPLADAPGVWYKGPLLPFSKENPFP